MRKAAIALNSIVVVFFTCFLAYTFFARQHLNSLARRYVTEKTVKYSGPLVDKAEEALDSPIVQKLLKEDRSRVIRQEITDYRRDPVAYIADLIRDQVRKAPLEKANPLLEKVAFVKDKIREYYGRTLDALIADLRAFAGVSLIAGLIAATLAFRSSPQIRQPIIWFSLQMFVAVVYCSYLFIDDFLFFTWFRILFRRRLGLEYAALLSFMLVGLWLDHCRHANTTGSTVGEPDSPVKS